MKVKLSGLMKNLWAKKTQVCLWAAHSRSVRSHTHTPTRRISPSLTLRSTRIWIWGREHDASVLDGFSRSCVKSPVFMRFCQSYSAEHTHTHTHTHLIRTRCSSRRTLSLFKHTHTLSLSLSPSLTHARTHTQSENTDRQSQRLHVKLLIKHELQPIRGLTCENLTNEERQKRDTCWAAAHGVASVTNTDEEQIFAFTLKLVSRFTAFLMTTQNRSGGGGGGGGAGGGRVGLLCWSQTHRHGDTSPTTAEPLWAPIASWDHDFNSLTCLTVTDVI